MVLRERHSIYAFISCTEWIKTVLSCSTLTRVQTEIFPSSLVCLISMLASRKNQEQKPTSNEVHHLLIIFVQQLLVFSPQHDLEVRPFFVPLFIFQYHSKTRSQHWEFRLRIKRRESKNIVPQDSGVWPSCNAVITTAPPASSTTY
jgi:hypothetical protein